VILGLIKKLLTIRKDFKVIVTSASMDTELFRQYFKTTVLKVSGRMFPVEELFVPDQNERDVTRKIEKVIN
jgi:HrpA-like RNA helicase